MDDNTIVYEIRCCFPGYTDLVYVGITNKPIHKRFKEHRTRANNKRKYQNNHLCNAMRAFGQEYFYTVLIKQCCTREDAEQKEIEMIKHYKEERGYRCLNMAPGGKGGYSMKNASECMRKAWLGKLKKARVGKKPALGMRHTWDNRKLFSQVSREYWDTQDTYTDKAEDILKLSHKEAKEEFGISKTHYYRLKRMFENK